MHDNDFVKKLQGTRLRVEALLHGPSVIHVSAAKSEDGASVLASLLARSFSEAGTSTLLMQSNIDFRSATSKAAAPVGEFERVIRAAPVHEPDRLQLDDLNLRTAGDIKALYSELRTKYDVSITSHVFSGDGISSSLASLSDAVIISLLKGRTVRESDRQLSEYLATIGISVFGVVFMSADTIKASREHFDVGEGSTARPVTRSQALHQPKRA